MSSINKLREKRIRQLPAISQEFLTRMVEGKLIARVHVSVRDGDFAYAFE